MKKNPLFILIVTIVFCSCAEDNEQIVLSDFKQNIGVAIDSKSLYRV